MYDCIIMFILIIIFDNYTDGMRRLILVRHGESLWNKHHRYTGWANVPLTSRGKHEAEFAGSQLKQHNVLPTISFSSNLERSIETNKIMFREMNVDIPIHREWRLNERHYGKLTGHDRNAISWVGNYFDLPLTNIEPVTGTSMVSEASYAPEFGESYYMTYMRVCPFLDKIKELTKKGEVSMLCSHRNTLRVVIKDLESLSNEEVPRIQVPNATPIIYDFDEDMNVIEKRILDEIL